MNRLKQSRLRLEISQYELEKITGIWQSKLSLMEAGYRVPNEEERERLAKAFMVDANWLFPKKQKEISK